MTLVTIGRLTAALNITKQRIGQLTKEGLPKAARGKYDLAKCCEWYIRYLQKALVKKSVSIDGVYVAERDQRVRSLRADADRKELELASRRGEMVAIADVEKEMTDLISATKARILSVPARVAGELIGENSRVMAQAKVEKALKEALSHLSEG